MEDNKMPSSAETGLPNDAEINSFLTAPGSQPAQPTVEPQQPMPDEQELQSFLGDEYTPGPEESALEQGKTFLEGAAEGVAGPLATGAETALGISTPEKMLKRREANPGMHALGQGAGLAGSMFTGVGEGALMAKAAEAVIPRVAGESIAKAVASNAGRAAIENMAFQAGDETSKMILRDPAQSAQTAIADIGLSGLLGGAIGGALGGVSGLWRAAQGNKAGQLVSDFRGRIAEHINNPDPHAALTEELQDLYSSTTSHADEVYGPAGLKAQEIAKVIPPMSEKIADQSMKHIDTFRDTISKMEAKPSLYPPRLAEKLKGDVDAYLTVAANPNVTSAELFNATQDLKQATQAYAKFDKFVKPVDEAYDFVREAKKLAHGVRESLEDTEVWGKAAERQKSINKAFTEYLPKLKDFEKKFTVEINGERQIDPGKVQTYLNQAEKASGSTKRQMLGNFVEGSQKYRDQIAKTHENLGIESLIEPTSLHHVMSSLEERTPGAKLADWFIQKGLTEGGSRVAGGATGAVLGSVVGHPAIGAIVGQHALAPLYNTVLPALVKPLVEGSVNSAGLKAAVDYGMSVAKGEAAIYRATKSMFKAGQAVIPASLIPSDSETDKLDKQLKSLIKNPNQLLKDKADVGHYMPDHSAELSKSAMNSVDYLNSIRPNNQKLSPLDSDYPLSASQKGEYRQQLSLAQSPLQILDRVAKGTVTPKDISTISALYPDLYRKLVTQAQVEMMNHVAKGESVSYKTRIGLSMFAGQAMDSTFLPGSIISAQLQPSGQQQQAPQGGGKQKGSPKALEKLSGEYKTPAQNRQQNLQTKD